jgi:hypothetical protein
MAVVDGDVGDLVGVPLGLVFDTVGAGLPDEEAVAVGTAAVVVVAGGALAPVDVVLQPATIPTMRTAPITMPVVGRRRPLTRTRIVICRHPSLVSGGRH